MKLELRSRHVEIGVTIAWVRDMSEGSCIYAHMEVKDSAYRFGSNFDKGKMSREVMNPLMSRFSMTISSHPDSQSLRLQ